MATYTLQTTHDEPDNGHDAIRASIRARLASGALSPVGREVIAWHGSGNDCVVCCEPISRTDVEYEVPLGERIVVVAHAACYAVWLEESDARTIRESA